MTNTGTLPPLVSFTEEDRINYIENGYVVKKKTLNDTSINLYNQRFADIANGIVPRHPFMILMKDITLARANVSGDVYITKLQEFQDDEVLFQYCLEPAILFAVRQIIGEHILAIHTMYINKPPDSGMGTSRHPTHQDLWYFPYRPADKICGAWTAMQTINRQNGCLYVLPGSHRDGIFYEHAYPGDPLVNKAYYEIAKLGNEEEMAYEYLEMEAGDTVFFHPLLIHGSGKNNSQFTRKALCSHYASTDCEVIDVKGTIQEGFGEEMEEMARRKGLNMSFAEIWKYKSRFIH